jgi:O-antigen ligase
MNFLKLKNLNLILNNSFNLFFALLSLSLISSMAGLSGAIIAMGFIAVVSLYHSNSVGIINRLQELRFDGENVVGLFASAVALSIVFNNYSIPMSFEIFSSLDWIPRFVALIYLFRTYLTRNFFLKCLDFLIVVSYLIAIYAIEQHLFGKDVFRKDFQFDHFGNQFRATGFFSIPLTFSYVVGSFGLVLGFLAYFNKQKKYFYSSGAIACFICVFCSGTRGAWLALASTLLISSWFVNKKVFLKCLLGLAIIFSVLMMDGNFRKRINTLINIQSSGSNISRMNIWTAYKEMYMDHPIFGVGYEQNRKLLPEYYKKLQIKEHLVSHAHNDYLQVLVGAGIVGLVTYLAMLGFFVRKNYRLIKKIKVDPFLKGLTFGIFALQIYICLGGITQVNFTDSVVNYTLLYYWSILYFIDRELTHLG